MKRNVPDNDKRIKKAVLDALGYYSVIRFPLKAEEIYNKMPLDCAFSKLLVALEDLTRASQIFKYKGYYSTDRCVEQMVVSRLIANN